MKFISEKTANGNVGMSTISQEIANAQAAQMDELKNYNCENCWGCFGCTTCVNCSDCSMCGGCFNYIGGVDERGANSLLDINKRETHEKQIAKVLQLVEKYFSAPVPASYNLPEAMRQAGIIPHRYLSINIATSKIFKDGGGAMLDIAVEGLKESGCLTEISVAETKESFNYRGKVYKFSGWKTEDNLQAPVSNLSFLNDGNGLLLDK